MTMGAVLSHMDRALDDSMLAPDADMEAVLRNHGHGVPDGLSQQTSGTAGKTRHALLRDRLMLGLFVSDYAAGTYAGCLEMAASRSLRPSAAAVSDTMKRNDTRNSRIHSEPFLRAAELLGFDPVDCIVVEDSLPGCVAGLAAGINAVAWPEPGRDALAFFVRRDHRRPP